MWYWEVFVRVRNASLVIIPIIFTGAAARGPKRQADLRATLRGADDGVAAACAAQIVFLLSLAVATKYEPFVYIRNNRMETYVTRCAAPPLAHWRQPCAQVHALHFHFHHHVRSGLLHR